MTSVFRYRPSVRKGSRLVKASLSPGGLLATAGLVGAGLLLGLPAAFVAAAGVAGFLTSAILHLRDPKLAAAMLAPEFDRDLSALDQDHLPLMLGALEARDRLDGAISVWEGAEMEGVKTRVTQTCRRMYDSVLWLQRADQFLGSVDEDALVAALEEGRIAGAALDVFATEPHVPAALLERDDVVLLPHVGSATVQTREAMGRLVLDNVDAFLERGELVTPVG